MKTILFHVNSFLSGGIEKILLEVLNALDPNKYNIKLSIAYDFGDKEILKKDIPEYVEVHYLLDEPFFVSTHKKKKTGKLSLIEKLLVELIIPPFRKKAQKNKLKKILNGIDVVIDFDTTLSPFYKYFADKKTIAYCHFGLKNIWRNKLKLDKLVRRLSNFDHIVMLCEEMHKDAALLYPSLSSKLVTIYNAMDTERIKKLAKEEIVIPEDFIHNGFIVSVGRLQESQKDFTTLIYAYTDCVKNYDIQERLVIVGNGNEKEYLARLADKTGLKDRILFTSHQENPYKWIDKSIMFLFSSKYEGLPTVLIEAHILNKPIVATACPTGVIELLMNGEAGILVNVGDVKAMSEAIYKLLNDTILQQQFTEKAKELLPQFDIKYMIPKLEKLFD